MSARDVIAETIRAEGWTCEYHEPVSGPGECSQCDDSHERLGDRAVIDLAAAGFVVVELPEPDMEGEHVLSETEGHPVANFFAEGFGEWVLSCCGEVDVLGLPPKMSPTYARDLAARLLAAAAHAEAGDSDD